MLFIFLLIFMNESCLNSCCELDFLQEIFNALSDQNRIKIICLLGKNESLCVCEIVNGLDLKQNLVSHHLGVLRKIDLIEQERKGKYIHYKLNELTYNKLKSLIGKIFNF